MSNTLMYIQADTIRKVLVDIGGHAYKGLGSLQLRMLVFAIKQRSNWTAIDRNYKDVKTAKQLEKIGLLELHWGTPPLPHRAGFLWSFRASDAVIAVFDTSVAAFLEACTITYPGDISRGRKHK